MKKRAQYQKGDAGAFDYQIYFPDESFEFGLRGPRLPWHIFDRYHAAIGSAGVFGRFCQQPYVQQLTLSGYPTVNLGLSGARPGFFLEPSPLIEILSGAHILLLEFMSARGYPTRFYTPVSVFRNTGAYTSPNGETIPNVFVDHAWQRAMRDYGPDVIDAEIAASRLRYADDMRSVLQRFGRQVVLLWIGQRGPDYQPGAGGFPAFSGGFPHLVDRSTRDAVLDFAVATKDADNVRLVEVISDAGLPQPIFDRLTGEPANVLKSRADGSRNTYYPSPAMHDLAAARLLPAFRALAAPQR